MPYGIANTTGRPNVEIARQIINLSWQGGIRYFDTAQAYGESEAIVGQVLRDLGVANEAQIITKLSPSVDITNVDAILASLRFSLEQLGLRRLWGVLLHREEQLDHWENAVGEAFTCARSEGLVSHVGVSVYSPQRGLQALDLRDIDVLQVPANVFDRRMKRAGVFQQARTRSVKIFIRSAYLQGLALLPNPRVAQLAPFALNAVEALDRFCCVQLLDRQEFALRYALALDANALVVVGAEMPAQIAGNCRAAALPSLPSTVSAAWDAAWPNDDELLVNPSLWPKCTTE